MYVLNASTHTHMYVIYIYTHTLIIMSVKNSFQFYSTRLWKMRTHHSSSPLTPPHPRWTSASNKTYMHTKQELQVPATAAYPVIQAGTSRSQHLEDRQVAVLRRTHQGRLQCLVLRVQACSSLNNRLKKCSICSSTSRKLHVSINMYILHQKKIQQLV